MSGRIDEIVLRHAIARGTRPTVLTVDESCDGDRLARTIHAVRAELAAAGVAPGHRVAVVTTTVVSELAGLLAVMGGATAVPVPIGPPVEVARRHLTVSGATHVLTDGAPSTMLDAALDVGLPVISNWGSTTAPVDSRRPTAWACAREDDVAAILLTSGSTGSPKAVPVRHRAFVLTTGATAQLLQLGSDDCTLVAQPATHVAGLSSGMLLGLRAGGATAVLRRFEPGDVLDAMHRWQPTLFTGTPSMHLALVREAAQQRRPFPASLRFVRTGGGRLDEDARAVIEHGYACEVLPAYGMSEALQITQVPPGEGRPGSVGPSIGPQLRIVLDGGPAPTGVVGTVQIRGPTVFSGYDGGGGPDDEGWFTTGDRGRLDPDGWLHVDGRTDDVVLRGGRNVSLLQVERVVRQFPGVTGAVAAGVPHPMLGEDVGAIVAAPADLDVAGLRGHVHDRLGASHVPTTVLVIGALPLLTTGKPDRLAAARLLEEAAANAVVGIGGPPEGRAEGQVAAAVEDVLACSGVGRDDDLFALGATSLDVAAIADRLTAVMGHIVHVTAIVACPTVRTLAATLAPTVRSSDRPGMSAAAAVRLGPVGPAVAGEARVAVSPVLVLSPPRSGSTLLRSMLAGHPALFAPPELRLLGHATTGAWAAAHEGPRRPLRDGLTRAVMGARRCSADTATKVVEAWVRQDLPVGAVYEQLAQWVAPRRLVDKSPLTALDPTALERAEQLFDQPHYVHLVRDPRAVAASFARAGLDQLWSQPFDGDPVDLGIAAWEHAHTSVLEFLEEVPRRRQVRVTLPDLTRAPDAVMRRLLGHLGLDFHEAATRAHDEPATRMTDGVVPGARMIGDPRFWTRETIEPADQDLGGVVPARLLSLAGRLGLPDGSVDATRQHVIVQQRRLLQEWPDRVGVWSHPVAPCPRPPLFWILQNPRELAALRETAPRDAGIVALRSMHLLGREPAVVDVLAALYADEIGLLQPRGPVYLGGNCQGGTLAHRTATELRRRGRAVDLLWTLDAQLRTPYDGRLVLLSGRESEGFNPRLADPDERPLLHDLHPNLTLAEVPGTHGQYFGTDHLGPLVSAVLEAADAAGRS